MGFVTLTGAEFKKFMANDYAAVRDMSPYANWTEKDVIANLDDYALRDLIIRSSYYRKNGNETNVQSMKRWELKKYYYKCRNYATESIVNSLYPVNKLKEHITHIDCATEKFYILSRVRTEYERPTIEETAKERTYLSFTLNNQFNLSHYPGKVWFGYYTGITSDMIGLILSHDADTRSWARNRRELGASREELFDCEDLMAKATQQTTYPQISIKAETTNNSTHAPTPVFADCILCISQTDDTSLRASDEQELPIIVLHPSGKTVCRIHDYCKTSY